MTDVAKNVVVLGGSPGGVAAAVQAARLGAEVLLIEQSPWLGGGLTNGGFSVLDSNPGALSGGIAGQVRALIQQYYGNPSSAHTGLIGHTTFEPFVGNIVFNELISETRGLECMCEAIIQKFTRSGDNLHSVNVTDMYGEELRVSADQWVIAEDSGAIAELAGLQKYSAEYNAADDVLCNVILKKFYRGAPIVPASGQFTNDDFVSVQVNWFDYSGSKWSSASPAEWKEFLSVLSLPSKKLLMPLRLPERYRPRTIDEAYSLCRRFALDFIHYLQTELQHTEWGLALDEFTTVNRLPAAPFLRAGRGSRGMQQYGVHESISGKVQGGTDFIPGAIAVGTHNGAPFQVPARVLFPDVLQNVLVTGRNLAADYSLRTDCCSGPVDMVIGQAAGVFAALLAEDANMPREVAINQVQSVLINFGAQVFPYVDVWNYQPIFGLVQRAALKGARFHDAGFTFNSGKIVEKEELAGLLPGEDTGDFLAAYQPVSRSMLLRQLAEKHLI